MNTKLRSVSGVAIVVLGLAIVLTLPWLPRTGQSVLAAVRGWFAPAPQGILLVTTDSDCDWTLDGKPQRRLRAKESSSHTVVLGQHLIEARTTDGADEWRGIVEIHSPEQHIAGIMLEVVRENRLATARVLAEKKEAMARIAEQQRTAQARREEEQRQQQEATTKRERERTEAISRGWWLDQQSGIMWGNPKNNNEMTWEEAVISCRNMRLGGFSNWRLPSIDEWEGQYDSRGARRSPVDPRGGLGNWSGTIDVSGDVLVFTGPGRHSVARRSAAVCVRDSGT